jgi:hypothetical protein
LNANGAAELAETSVVAATASAVAAEIAVDVAAISAVAAMGAASCSSSLTLRRHRLQVSDAWMRHHTPSIQSLEVMTPTMTPMQQHAVRRLRAHGSGGEPLSDTVRYSLPPPDGESKSAAARRNERHWQREQTVLQRLDRSLAQCSRARDDRDEALASLARLRAEAAEARAAAKELAATLLDFVSDADRQHIEEIATARATAVERKPFELTAYAEAEAMASGQLTFQDILDAAAATKAQWQLPPWSEAQRTEQQWVELALILKSLHSPRLIWLSSGFATKSRPLTYGYKDFGIGSFAHPAFFTCLQQLHISPDPSLLHGYNWSGYSDEPKFDSLYFCLCEYREVLRVHKQHEPMLYAELAKAKANPDYMLPSRPELYPFPELNNFAARAAALTWHCGFGPNSHGTTNTCYDPKWRRGGRIHWKSQLEWEYDVLRGWRRNNSPYFLTWEKYESHFGDWARIVDGTDTHLSLENVEVLCDALEIYAQTTTMQ